MKIHQVSVDIRSVLDNGYRLKISVLDLGLYMDGFRATRSERSISGWWLQPPARKVGNKWLQIPEFDKHNTLWREIEQAAIDAVNEEDRGVKTDNNDKRPTFDELDQIFPGSEVLDIT